MLEIKDYMTQLLEKRQTHINLSESCHLRGTDSIQCRGLLAYYLDTTIPHGSGVECCHACHNADCSNPKHLYWGTRSENVRDKFTSPQGAAIRKAMSNSKLGNKNANYRIKPWLNVNAKNNEKVLDGWRKAMYYYETYFIKGWNYSKYGGISYFCNEYGISRGSAVTMLKMFRDEWIPNKDPQWINFARVAEPVDARVSKTRSSRSVSSSLTLGTKEIV